MKRWLLFVCGWEQVLCILSWYFLLVFNFLLSFLFQFELLFLNELKFAFFFFLLNSNQSLPLFLFLLESFLLFQSFYDLNYRLLESLLLQLFKLLFHGFPSHSFLLHLVHDLLLQILECLWLQIFRPLLQVMKSYFQFFHVSPLLEFVQFFKNQSLQHLIFLFLHPLRLLSFCLFLVYSFVQSLQPSIIKQRYFLLFYFSSVVRLRQFFFKFFNLFLMLFWYPHLLCSYIFCFIRLAHFSLPFFSFWFYHSHHLLLIFFV